MGSVHPHAYWSVTTYSEYLIASDYTSTHGRSCVATTYNPQTMKLKIDAEKQSPPVFPATSWAIARSLHPPNHLWKGPSLGGCFAVA